ncbi:hypothetical protein NP493_3g04010 [Ridgeia piscesae]|uniref:FERM domain-containing protein n=1 Tax=Ridgeia piscesae TaxID=27915 RepID=A0AAD9ULL5_RIDPI|nr:hypothetical protein NP493_3g04010 [Ridgeia piscesae]
MEAVIAVLRPKYFGSVSRDFDPKAYDLLLIDGNLPSSENAGANKQFPKTTISFELEPADALFTYLYNLTGAELGGLKGKRAVFVPPSRNEASSSSVKGTLYCVPVDNREKLNAHIVNKLPSAPGFYSLDLVLSAFNSDSSDEITESTQGLINRLVSWLQLKENVPGAIDLLFSVCAEERLKRSITNPAYFSSSQSALSSGAMGEVYSNSIANEALAKMVAIEKCDITIKNPIFESDMSYKNKVDKYAVNQYWGMGRPDYTKIKVQPCFETQANGNSIWTEEFPLHKCAYEGNARGTRDLIRTGYSVRKKDKDSWAPIHYAAWYGHLEVISVLLNDGGCSPNLTNNNGSTPLHIAARNGRVYVIELLLNHPEIDVSALDHMNHTALELCGNVDKPDWKAAARLLKNASTRPSPKIQVCLMDGTFRMLDLVSGANTTVQQLHQQMLQELKLPDSCSHIFSLWICSPSLQLQLKSDHKPIEHLNDWKRKIVVMYTDKDPSHEDPNLVWRRDAIISIAEDKEVRHPVAIRFLFHEAYYNCIESMYPCSDQDVMHLAAILMQLYQGDFDQRKAKNYLNSEHALTQLVPVAKLRNKSINWANKILEHYKTYTQKMVNRDKSPTGLHLHYLTVCWNLTVYGSAFFSGYVQVKPPNNFAPVHILVNDIGIHIISYDTKMMLQSISYTDIEWSYKTGNPMYPIFEIRLKGHSKGAMSIVSKQAGLINHLTGRLSQLSNEPFHSSVT